MKHENSAQSRLEVIVNEREPGDLLFPSDYLDIGTPESIHMAFSRLTKEKKLQRMGKGIYFKPKTDPLLGPVHPGLEEIARKIAEKEKVIIRPTGSYALNRLGLSTQVPMKVVFLTNGNSRSIKVGRGTITFISTTPKKLSSKNDLVYLAIQALIELREEGNDPKIIDRLTAILRNAGPVAIREDAKSAPTSVARILYRIAEKIENDD